MASGGLLESTEHVTKQHLLEVGKNLLLQGGYNDLGLQGLLARAGVPKGSFYYHFRNKEDFGLQAIDFYMAEVHRGLDECLEDPSRSPLERVRRFFETSRDKYRLEGNLGCLLGGLGQELSGTSEAFRRKVEWCFSMIADRLAACLERARQEGELPRDSDPRDLANVLLNCWEGAALRCRLLRDTTPLDRMLDFYFSTLRVAT